MNKRPTFIVTVTIPLKTRDTSMIKYPWASHKTEVVTIKIREARDKSFTLFLV